MKIQQDKPVYQNNQAAFKGIPYAKAALKFTPEKDEIIIYKLEQKDLPFLRQMVKNLKLDKLAPEVKDTRELGEWKHIIEEAASGIECDVNVYLSTYKNIPCAIMSHLADVGEEWLEIFYTASWPYKTGQNAKCAAKALFRNIFDMAQKEKRGVVLVLSDDAPKGKRNNRPFYKKLNFEQVDNDNCVLKILQNKNISKVIKKELDPVMDFELLPKHRSVNLSKALDITY